MMTRLVSSFLQPHHSKKVVMLLLLLVVRMMLMIGWCTHHGYIHPDEFFQSGQELWYGIRLPSWEFQSSHCLRSIVPPTIMTSLPLFVWNQFSVPPNNIVVYVLPRIFMGFVSFVLLDLPLWLFHTNSNRNTMMIWSSMWTTWTFFHRPFTNVMESWYVAIILHLLLLLLRSSSNHNHHPAQIVLSYIGLGIVASLGINCRFTFVLFVGPVILYHFYTLLLHHHHSSSFRSIWKRVMTSMIGFIGTSILWISMDTNYYNKKDQIQITPWNAFQYNRQVSNLQHHGIHPHYLHLVVNMPLLYGPLALYFYYTELNPFLSVPQTTTTKTTTKSVNNHNTNNNISRRVYCRIIIWSGLLGLSIAPHQEPRFLLPLAYPLVQLYSTTTIFQNKLFQSIWWIWTISVGCWFSFYHQSAVIPSLHYLTTLSQQQSSKAIIYYHTYMPPTFMLSSSNIKLVMGDIPLSSAVCPSLQLSQEEEEEVVTKFYDLTSNDATLDTLDYILHRHLNTTTNDSSSFVYVVAPKASIPTTTTTTMDKTYEWTPLWSQFQISVEELPSTPFIHTLLTNPSSFHLVIWKVQTMLN